MPNREPADLLIESRRLLAITPTGGVLAEQATVVSAGRILATGPAAELRARFAARESLQRPHHVLLPGLVNAATHAAHQLLRGLVARQPRTSGAALTALAGRCASADFVRDGTRLGMAEMLRAGITCFADLGAFPEEAARTAAAAQMRAAIGLPVSDGANLWAENATAHFARAERLWDEYRSDSRISLYFAPLAARTLSDATLVRIRRVADELEARVALDVTLRMSRLNPSPRSVTVRQAG
jgi:5-methylthioadenosine/S-adenosylhomocysteine deaminase